jgi:hypothetical protein
LSDSAEDAWDDLGRSLDDAFAGVSSAVKGFFSKR